MRTMSAKIVWTIFVGAIFVSIALGTVIALENAESGPAGNENEIVNIEFAGNAIVSGSELRALEYEGTLLVSASGHRMNTLLLWDGLGCIYPSGTEFIELGWQSMDTQRGRLEVISSSSSQVNMIRYPAEDLAGWKEITTNVTINGTVCILTQGYINGTLVREGIKLPGFRFKKIGKQEQFNSKTVELKKVPRNS
jgi:hypothetical protein